MRPRPRIVVVHLDEGRAEFSQRINRLDGVTMVVGDARDLNILRQAGIARAYSLSDIEPDLERCMADAGALLGRLAEQIAADWLS